MVGRRETRLSAGRAPVLLSPGGGFGVYARLWVPLSARFAVGPVIPIGLGVDMGTAPKSET
jgi:hypothetical protein